MILWQHRKIKSISNIKRKCRFMLNSNSKSCPSATGTFFQARCTSVKDDLWTKESQQITREFSFFR